MRYRCFITVFICCISFIVFSQEAADTASSPKISAKYLDAVNKKAEDLTEDLDRKSKKVLARMQKQEARLQRKLAKIDSLAAKTIFSTSAEKYNQLHEKLKNSTSLSQYIPKLDTLATSLKFLDQHSELIEKVKDAKEKLCNASSKLKEMQAKLQSAEDIKQFLKERKGYLKQQLEKFGFAKELKKINKEAYYFAQQVNEYKEILKDPKKAERKAIELLTKTKLFKDFMKKNSTLASLFGMSAYDLNTTNTVNAASLIGLQSRVQVNGLIQGQLAMGGLNSQRAFQQNVQQGQSQLQRFRERMKISGGGNDAEPPDFKPNSQKTKSFLQRLELGANIQSQKGNGLLPVTSDLGFSIGYRINDQSICGIGGSYKLGWGHGWNNIRFSSQGASVRSFIDWKLKASFYVSGGYEMNYRPALAGIRVQTRIGVFNADQWQPSGLLGISKIISTKSKLFKKTKAQLLWDFMAQSQIPKSQSLVFRINYSFK